MEVRTIDIVTQKQQEPVWCWAAVGTVCALFIDKKSGWTQCKLASKSIVPPPGDCCIIPKNNKCLTMWFVLNETKDQGSFFTTGIANGYTTGAPDFSVVKQNVKDALPMAFRMQHKLYGLGHFVAVKGYIDDQGKEKIMISDSLYGDSVVLFSQFITDYRKSFSLTHTFYTKYPI